MLEQSKSFLLPEGNIESNTKQVVVVADTCLNPFCSDVHISSPPLAKRLSKQDYK